MNMGEMSRLIIVLRKKGWTDKEINDFVLFVENAQVEIELPANGNKDATK